MKRITAFLSVLLLAVSFLSGCSGTGEPVSTNDPAGDITQSPVTTQPPQSESTAAELSETLVYDTDGIKITATGMEEGFMGTEIRFLVENGTDKNISFSGDLFIVNGITVSGYVYVDVAAGKKSNDTLTLYSSDLEAAGIDTIGTIESKDTRIVDTDSFDTIASVPFTLSTSAADTVTQTIDDTGDVLYEQSGVTVIAQIFTDEFNGSSVRLLVKNQAGKDVTVQAENISVNGFTVDAWMYDTVYADTVRYCDLDLFSSGLEENGIETIENVTFTLKLIDPNTFDTIAASDELQVFVGQ